MDADQLHPPSGDGPVATADERRNIAGLDNDMNVLQTSPLVKKLPARKNELLRAFFRDDSLARTKGEPIAMWLVRFNEQLGKLNRVGIDIVTALPDVVLSWARVQRLIGNVPLVELQVFWPGHWFKGVMGTSWSLSGRRRTRTVQPGPQLAASGGTSRAWRMWWSQASALRITCCVHRSCHPPLDALDLRLLLALSSGGAIAAGLGPGHAGRCA